MVFASVPKSTAYLFKNLPHAPYAIRSIRNHRVAQCASTPTVSPRLAASVLPISSTHLGVAGNDEQYPSRSRSYLNPRLEDVRYTKEASVVCAKAVSACLAVRLPEAEVVCFAALLRPPALQYQHPRPDDAQGQMHLDVQPHHHAPSCRVKIRRCPLLYNVKEVHS